MENDKTNGMNVQGTKTPTSAKSMLESLERTKLLSEMKEETQAETKKKQKASESYTITSLGENITKLEDMELISKEDADTLKNIHAKIAIKWMERKMGIKVEISNGKVK